MKRASDSRAESRRELILGCGTLAIALVYYLFAVRIPASDIADVIGPQGLPKTYAVVLAGLSIILIARSLAARRAIVETDPLTATVQTEVRRTITWRVVGMLMSGVVYIAIVPWLGYMVSLAGLIAATIYFQGGSLNRRSAAVAVGGAVLFWLLFVRILHVAHPAGIWPSLL